MSNNENLTELDSFEGERGMPSVNAGKPSTAKRGAVVIAMLLVIGLAAAAIFWKTQQRAEQAAGVSEARGIQQTNAVPVRTFGDPPPLPASATPPPAPAPQVVPPPLPVASEPNTGAAPALPGDAGGQRAAPALDKSGSGLMAVQADQSNAGAGAGAGNPGSLTAQDQGGGALSGLLTGTQTNPSQAGHIGNRNFLLAKGSFIDCALQTRLDSTVPGMTSCVVTRNIYSDNGKILLVERGSTVSGEYQSNMRQGMARIFVLWTRIKTPHGVVINLDSPGTDPLGGAGVPGWVDNHFWKRFGGALMLSLVDDVARYATSGGSSSGNQFNFNSTGDATQDMATEALKNTINIPPTLYKNQGEQVGIYIARDLDFSSVYDVATTE